MQGEQKTLALKFLGAILLKNWSLLVISDKIIHFLFLTSGWHQNMGFNWSKLVDNSKQQTEVRANQN